MWLNIMDFDFNVHKLYIQLPATNLYNIGRKEMHGVVSVIYEYVRRFFA